jgi:hypothetical protein
MAERGYTVDNSISGVKIVTWSGLQHNDTGKPFTCPMFADKSVQVAGDFGGGGTVLIQGSNYANSSAYATLNDPQGNALSITTAKIEQILENTFTVRPSVTGDGSTNLVVTMLVSTPTEYSNHVPDQA